MLRHVPKKVYTNKSLIATGDVFGSIKPHWKPNKTDKPHSAGAHCAGVKAVAKRKVSDPGISPSGQVKRGPGRPKKIQKQDDGGIGDDRRDAKDKRLKLDCGIKQKTSSCSSSDLSPPVLEPWSPFSPRKDSTRTPPTLSPVSSVAAKLSDAHKSSDDEKCSGKKVVKKRSTSLVQQVIRRLVGIVGAHVRACCAREIIPKVFDFRFQTTSEEDELRPPVKKRKVGRPRKIVSADDEGLKKPQSQNQKKEKPICSSSAGLISSVATIKVNQIETSSSGQYKIKPKLKAEVKVSRNDLSGLKTICNYIRFLLVINNKSLYCL